MNILASVHLYPPEHLCGAEFMLHGINKHMQAKGDTVKVLLHQANQYKIESHYIYDNVDVFPPDQNTTLNLFRWADMAFTHLDYTNWTIGMGAIQRRPVFHLIHNTHNCLNIETAEKPQFIVYNSEWAKQELGYKHDSIVLHPPVDWRFYDTNIDPSLNEAITLINLDHNKGGHILRQIAEAMPYRKFIGVVGSYSEPWKIGQYTDQPANVTVVPKTDNIREIYRQTRILIMPSEYESWGRTATEAMCSGIPVISTGTPGLQENCGKAGIYVERENVSAWVDEIERLFKARAYAKASLAAKVRSRELDPVAELDALHGFLRRSVEWYKLHA